jgi:hypothetical protein
MIVFVAAHAAFVTLRRQHVQEKQLHTAQQVSTLWEYAVRMMAVVTGPIPLMSCRPLARLFTWVERGSVVASEFAVPPQDPGGQPFRFLAGCCHGRIFANAGPPVAMLETCESVSG